MSTDHEEIRRWAEAHGARPARVKALVGGMIQAFSETFPETGWFDENGLALVYEADQRSTFTKLVSRETAEAPLRR